MYGKVLHIKYVHKFMSNILQYSILPYFEWNLNIYNEELFSRYDWSFVLRIHRIINSTIPIEMFWPFLTDTIQFVLIEPSRSCIIQIWRLISPNICVGPWTISCNFATMTCRRNRMFWVRTVTNSDKYAPAADPKANIQIQHSDNNGSLATPKEEGTPLFLHNSDNQQF